MKTNTLKRICRALMMAFLCAALWGGGLLGVFLVMFGALLANDYLNKTVYDLAIGWGALIILALFGLWAGFEIEFNSKNNEE